MVWPELIGGALGGAANFFGQKSQAKAQKDQMKKVLAYLQQAFGASEIAGGLALQQLGKGQKALGAGFDQALAETTNAGRASELEAISRSRELGGADTQALISAGWYSPDALEAAKRGRSADLQRTLAMIGSNTAQNRANLFTGRGAAMANSFGNIANQYNLDASRQIGLFGEMADTAASFPAQSNNMAPHIGSFFGGIDWSQLFNGGGGGAKNWNNGINWGSLQG